MPWCSQFCGGGEEGLLMHVGDLGDDGEEFFVWFCVWFCFLKKLICVTLFSSEVGITNIGITTCWGCYFFLKSWESGISFLFNNVTFTRASGLWISTSLCADIEQSPHFRITYSRKQLRFGCLTHLDTWTSYQYRIIHKVHLTSSAALNNNESNEVME